METLKKRLKSIHFWILTCATTLGGYDLGVTLSDPGWKENSTFLDFALPISMALLSLSMLVSIIHVEREEKMK